MARGPRKCCGRCDRQHGSCSHLPLEGANSVRTPRIMEEARDSWLSFWVNQQMFVEPQLSAENGVSREDVQSLLGFPEFREILFSKDQMWVSIIGPNMISSICNRSLIGLVSNSLSFLSTTICSIRTLL